LKQLFFCHSGSPEMSDERAWGNAVMGCVYEFRGKWIRSPEDVKDRDRNAVMELWPYIRYYDGEAIYGDVGCFTPVLEEWWE